MKRLLIGGTVVDATGRPPIENGAVLVNGARIEAVGRAADFSVSQEDVQVVDCGGRAVVPGLINAHAHLGLDGDAESYDTKLPKLARLHDTMITLISAQQAYRNLVNGITTVRDLHPCSGGTQYAVLSLRDAIKAGTVPGCRIVAAARPICMLGGHGSHWVSREASGAEDVRRAVREQVKDGADVIKMMAGTSWGPIPGKPVTYARQLTREEMAAGVDAAHGAGRVITAHSRGKESIADVLAAGVDCVEHGSELTSDLVDIMAKKGTYLVPTLQGFELLLRQGPGPQLPSWKIEDAQYVIQRDRPGIAQAIAAGVKIAAGTDAGFQFCPHGEIVVELELYVQLGMTPMQALMAATKVGAELLQLKDDIGTLEPGKLADLLVVNGNPAENISALRNPALVMKEGAVYRDDLAAAVREPVPA